MLRLASGGAAKKKARAELLRELRVDLRRGELLDDVLGGSGLSVIDEMLDWSRDTNLSKKARTKLAATASKQEKALTKLYKQMEEATAKVDRLQSVWDSVEGGLNRFDLGGALAQQSQWTKQTDAAGNTWYTGSAGSPATGSSIAAKAKARAADIKAFSQKLARLQQAGLSGIVLSEIAALGSEEGGQVADALLADLGSVKSINTAYADIAKSSGQAAQYVTEGYEKGGLAAAKAAVAELNKQASGVGTTMAKEFASALGYKLNASGTSVKKKAAGGPVTAGELYQVNELGIELFRPQVNGYILNAAQTRQVQQPPQAGPISYLSVNVNNHYPQAEPTSVTVNRALQFAAFVGLA